MKPKFSVRPLAFLAMLSLSYVGAAFAQTADPSATIAPSKPAAATSTPAGGAAVNSSPAATEKSAATPKKAELTTEEKAARRKARLEKYDTNKDGKIDKKERAAIRAARGMTTDADKAKASPTP